MSRRRSWSPLIHVERLWGKWWLLPAIPLLYALLIFAIGDMRREHVGFALGCCVLGWSSQRTRRFLIDASPIIAVGIGYDLVRYARSALLSPDRVVGCGLRNLELRLFSVSPGVTLQDWLVLHHAPALDLLFATPYAAFVYVAGAYAAYLYFTDRRRMHRYAWAFAIANYLSFALWLAVPAAPPWYLREHGCAIDLAVLPSPAALARVDELLGIQYFHDFYARAASVFGALPSMHCAYPVLGLLTARGSATWRTWPLHVTYTLLMFAAAVYLDHHWIIDGLAGWALAGAAVYVAEIVERRLHAAALVRATGRDRSPEVEPASELAG
jgi:hypothetical protein